MKLVQKHVFLFEKHQFENLTLFDLRLGSLWLSFEQKMTILPALGFIIPKRQNLTFGLTLTRELSAVLKS